MNTTNSIMTDTNINQAIVSILSGVKSAGGEVYSASKTAIASGIDIVKAQAPDLVHEFVKWKFAEAAVFTIIGVIGLLVIFTSWYKFNKKCDWDGEVMTLSSLVCAVITIPCCVLTCNIMTMIQIWIAPKIYLIEYIVKAIK